MPISIAGSGTITGISAGGLPDDSIIAADIAAGAVTTAKVADANITAAKLSGAQSGSAPIYAARAWVNFNGTGTVAIRTSGNVSSITDNGTGDYTVNFTTAMPDADYATYGSCRPAAGGSPHYVFYVENKDNTARTTSAIRTFWLNPTSQSAQDVEVVSFAVFR